MRYFLISPVWLWYCLRSRSLWFFTASNPTLTFGGFEGESKREMYDQLPSWSYPKTRYLAPAIPFEKVVVLVTENKFSYPFIVKPDVGMSGILFRIIKNEKDLRNYHHHIPVNYMIQELIQYEVEFSVFYYRYPHQQKGVITGFLQKELMQVRGDGKNTLLQLILQHPKARLKLADMNQRHKNCLEKIIPANEIFLLSHAANLSQGGHFINLKDEIDDQLHLVFDDLSAYSKTFFYGRYDLKAASIEDLKKGKNFSILEFNGSGAEPNHVYNQKLNLFQAYKEILKHWEVLYQISRYNNKHGLAYWSFQKGLRFLKESQKHFELLRKHDAV